MSSALDRVAGEKIERLNQADAREKEYKASAYKVDGCKFKKICGFTQSDLVKMSNLAKLAYYSPSDDVSELRKYGYYSFADLEKQGYKAIPFKGEAVAGTYLDGGQAFGNIYVKGNEVVIAYRGTMTGNDWKSNFDALRVERPEFAEGKGVHKGFYDIFKGSEKAVKNALFEYVADNGLKLQDLDIKFTGHSLGGALAKVAALEMSADPVLGERISGVATFADPRVFDFEAAKVYDKRLGDKTVRLSQQYDIVPKVAPGFMGYAHVGAQINIPLLKEVGDCFKGGVPHMMDGYHVYLSAMPEGRFKAETEVSYFNSLSKLFQRMVYGEKANFNATKRYAERLANEAEAGQQCLRC